MMFYIFSALAVLLDQLFKYWVTVTVEPGGSMEILRGVIRITNVKNSGAAFGLFSDMRWALVAVSAVCIIALAIAISHYWGNSWGKLALAAILGGAVGNFIDRLALGEVIDMFEFEFVNFAIFNIADVFITLGGIVFIVTFFIKSQPSEEEPEAETPAEKHRTLTPRAETPARTEPRPHTVSAPRRAVDVTDAEDMGFTVESILEEYYTGQIISGDDDGNTR